MMRRRTGRPNAPDIFVKATPVFDESKKVSFREAFPTIRHLSVEVAEIGAFEPGYNPPNGKDHYSEHTVAEFIRCHNPLCYGGGFRALDIVRDMVNKEEPAWETRRRCFGREGNASQARSRSPSPCINSFVVNITIDYEEG
jgi:hypothetical protein